MNFINEYALLVAVAVPVATIVGIQVFLFIGGERGTLLMPGFGGYPSIELRKAMPEPIRVIEAAKVDVAVEPSNDPVERIAA